MSFLTKIIILKAHVNYSRMAHVLHCHTIHTYKNERKSNLLINLLPSSQIPPSPNFLLLSLRTRFYALLKVYKPDIYFRPVVSNISTASYRLAQFLTSIFSPLLSANIHTVIKTLLISPKFPFL